MELEKQVVKKTREKSRAFSQITLDDDCIVKDSKPDVVKIIHTQGNVVFEESKVSNQAVWITGKLEFSVLYRSDDEHNRLEVLSGAIPFQEKMIMDGVEELDTVKMRAEMEDLSIGRINSRKLAVRAVVNLLAVAEENTEDELACGLLNQEGYEQKIEERDVLKLLLSKKDILRIRNEIKLPNSKPNIRRLLWYSIDIRNTESSFSNGKIHIQGEAYIGVLYLSEEEEQIQWQETMLQFAGDVDCEEVSGQDIFWVKLTPETMEIEARSDYDGEARVLGLDLAFEVDFKIWKEEKMEILEDVYALDRNVIPKREPGIFPRFLMKNIAKVRVGEQFKLETNQEKILQICSCKGEIGIDKTTVMENGISFEGVLRVHILYFTADDNFPIAHIETMLPFEQLVEVSGISADTWYDYEAALDSLQVNLLDHSEYEVKAALRLSVLAFEEERFDKLVGAEEQPLNMELLMNQPGLVGYVTQEKEELWDIAKHFHTSIDEIISTNALKSRKIKPGTKIIIVKKVGSC